MGTRCVYPPFKSVLPHWKFVLHCCANFPRIDLPSQKLDQHHSKTCPMIHCYVYHFIELCSVHRILPPGQNKIRACICVLVMTETSIADFLTSFCIPEIKSQCFTYQIYTVQGYITLETNNVNHLNVIYFFKIRCVVVVMPRECQPVCTPNPI